MKNNKADSAQVIVHAPVAKVTVAPTTAQINRGGTVALAGELRDQGIAVNALWPRTTIATAAIKNLLGGERVMRMSRKPEIMAEAACRIVQKPAKSFTGNFLIDDSFLAAEGVTDFEQYRVDAREPLAPTFFVPDEPLPPASVTVTGKRWD